MNKRHTSYLFSFLFCFLLFTAISWGQPQNIPESPPGILPGEIIEPPFTPPGEIIQPRIPQPAAEVKVEGEGEIIKSLELRGVDILDVLKIIAKQSSFNIVTSKNVRGPVTVYLKDIKVWDAFQLIVRANQLAYVKEGTNILVMTDKEYEDMYAKPFNSLTDIEIIRLQYASAMEVQKILTQMRTGRGPAAPGRGQGIAIDERANAIIIIDTQENIKETKRLVNELDVPTMTYVHKLNYMDCRELEKQIKPLLSKQGSINMDVATNKIIVRDVPENIITVKELIKEFDREPSVTARVFNLEYGTLAETEKIISASLTPNLGKMQSDKRTNKIIVTDFPSNLEKIDRILKDLDEKTRQVLIEAKVIQVILNDKNQMGINWEKAFYNLTKYHNLNIKGKFELATKGALSPGVELTIGELGDTKDDYTAFVQMLQTLGKTRTLSNPRISAINNQEASIVVGTQEAYVTQTTTQGESISTIAENVTFKDVGVTLKVTPTINREGMITMKITPEVSFVSSTLNTSQGNIIPIVSTSKTETNIMVKDGVTIIIGGLIKDERIKSSSQIPILGYIPIVGLLFQKKSDEVKKTELIILLTPRIITGEKGLGDIYKPYLEKNILEEGS